MLPLNKTFQQPQIHNSPTLEQRIPPQPAEYIEVLLCVHQSPLPAYLAQ